MPTIKQIQNYVKNKYGYLPKSCWIADVKEQMGIEVKIAHNRENEMYRKHPCPKNKIEQLKEAINFLT